MSELWRAVVGYEGRYEVSSLGRVRSVTRFDRNGVRRTGKVIAQQSDSDGRRLVHMKCDGVRKAARVHRLVLQAFVGPCPEGMEGCHNDGNASNNREGNLRWDTPTSNHADKKLHGTDQRGTRNWIAKLDDETVRRMREIRLVGAPFHAIAAHFGVTTMTARDAIIGATWGHV